MIPSIFYYIELKKKKEASFFAIKEKRVLFPLKLIQ